MEENTDSLQARKKALRLLERMDRTEKGLSDRLRQAGFSDEAVLDAVAYVKSCGYLDDGRYAGNYLRNHLNGDSKKKLMYDLRRKGIPEECALKAWEETIQEESCEPYDETGQILKILAHRYADADLEDPVQKRKVCGYLARRGFLWEDIMAALDIHSKSCKIYD